MYDKAEMLTKWSTVEKQQSQGHKILSKEINHQENKKQGMKKIS